MYQPVELARFALSEFERGLVGLTDEEARERMRKANGTEMNAIAWTIGHIAGHWLNRPEHLDRYNFQSTDPTPPPLDVAREHLLAAKARNEAWLPKADDALLSRKPGGGLGEESIGTGVMRAVLHTWFHTGEINAVRQLLGHAEIGFVGDITSELEWRSGADSSEGGYRREELARFSISEFERGLEGLTDAEAQARVAKADGSEMNAISWNIGHIAVHWLFVNTLMTEQRLPGDPRKYFTASADPTPSPLADMRALLTEAKERTEAWLENTDAGLLSLKRDAGPQPGENLGTQLMRAVLHTWFHTGETNAIRQMLGHAEIPFVGQLIGSLEWQSATGA